MRATLDLHNAWTCQTELQFQYTARQFSRRISCCSTAAPRPGPNRSKESEPRYLLWHVLSVKSPSDWPDEIASAGVPAHRGECGLASTRYLDQTRDRHFFDIYSMRCVGSPGAPISKGLGAERTYLAALCLESKGRKFRTGGESVKLRLESLRFSASFTQGGRNNIN